MPIFSKNKIEILYIHIPKTGGSAIAERFHGCGWKVDLHTTYAGWKDGYSTAPQHFHYEVLNDLGYLVDKDFTFITCRHPFDRFISEYFWQQVSIDYSVRYYDLEDYLFFVSGNIDTSYGHNHIRKQKDFYGNGVDYIKRQEDDTWSFLDRFVNISLIERLNTNIQNYNIKEYEYLRQRVEDTYQEDMSFFNY